MELFDNETDEFEKEFFKPIFFESTFCKEYLSEVEGLTEKQIKTYFRLHWKSILQI